MRTRRTNAGRLDAPLELWGGIECTVNRVQDVYFDQIERSLHAHRLETLDDLAALGVRALRFPVLWERTMPDEDRLPDWRWSDERLGRLRELGVRPIVGLVHHGSGPRHTSLVDPAFPEKLAHYARLVAERYPWVTEWTPVNEPLTTARFACLYGLWYPHAHDDRSFVRALLGQGRAIALAMRAIREVIPGARLVQTEDLGKTHSTRALAYQARFENARRWLTFDLLTGRVDHSHALWRYLRRFGATEEELDRFREDPCPPDIIGINHYLTSERFLDGRLTRYPEHTHGGNGRHRYADVEAVRVLADGPAGPRTLLREVWRRFRRPMAVTETHLGCTRDEQMRWFAEMWESACSLRDEGVDVRAVTSWSLLGAYDWPSLLTRADDCYEPGAFDVRAPLPRPTALARSLGTLAHHGKLDHPVLDGVGWWRRVSRLLYPPVRGRRDRTARIAQASSAAPHVLSFNRRAPRPLLITGATGTLGRAFAKICELRGLEHLLLTRGEMDIAERESVRAAIEEIRPWAVINAAGYVRVDDAEGDAERCLRENRDGPATLAEECVARGVSLVTFSSDLVFDGATDRPYTETDAPAPINVYGRSKAEAEERVLAAMPSALVVRTSAFFGPWDDYNFATQLLRSLAEGRVFLAADDAVISPAYVPDLVHSTLDLLIDGEHGIWHLANQGALTWLAFARLLTERAGLDPSLIEGRATWSLGLAAPRPLYTALASRRGWIMPPLEDAVERYLRDADVPAAEPLIETSVDVGA